ncbi:hypothetical protein MHTCC0001_27520 [Flavobacteriaceae bacterium MHTCC 0001]
MKLNQLKIVSIIFFLIIAREGDHAWIPIGFILLTSLFYIFSEFKYVIVQLLSFLGLILILYSIVKHRIVFVILGYLLTYIILINNLIDYVTSEKSHSEVYFLITTFIYFGLSMYVIAKSIMNNKNQPKHSNY